MQDADVLLEKMYGDPPITLAKASKALGITYETTLRLAKSGRIPAVQIGETYYILLSDIDRLRKGGMEMPFIFNFDATRIIETLQDKQTVMIDRLAEKMTFLMTRLQEKARSYTSGSIAESIRDPRAEVEGAKIQGKLEAGGDPTTISYKGGKAFDIARIFSEGSKPHVIYPLAFRERSHEKGAAKRAMVGKATLRFYSEAFAKPVFADYAFHPGTAPRPFMDLALQDMKDEIKRELQATVLGVLNE